MKTTIKTFVAICMMVTFTSSLNAQEWTRAQEEVWQAVESGWANWANKDVEGALAGLHDKYQGWNQDEPLPFNKQKMEKWYNSMKEMMEVKYYDIEPARITVTENAAVVDYYFSAYMEFTWGDEKKEKDVKGKNVEFFVKEKGKWLLLGDMTVHIDGDEDEDSDDD